ncbi:MAG: metallophosphoesterase, partial [Pedobacter sp.]
MGRIQVLIPLCLLLLAFDFYFYKAVLSVFKKWKPNTKRVFTAFWWTYNIALIIGVFAGIYLNLFLTLRAIILVAFFLTCGSKLVMLPFLLIDDLRRLVLSIFR